MVAVATFESEKFGAQTWLFLACQYCQKQLKTKNLIKDGIVCILKSVLKECCTVPNNKARLLK